MTMISQPYIVICKKCGGKVPAYSILSFSDSGIMHTDFYRENYGSQIIHYMLSICPDCQFVGYAHEFEEISKDVSNDNQPNLFEHILDDLKKQYPPTKRFIMLAERLEEENASPSEIANCYLKASWSERMMNTKCDWETQSEIPETQKVQQKPGKVFTISDLVSETMEDLALGIVKEDRPASSKELEKTCQQKAVKFFIKSLPSCKKEELSQLYYLIGELLRRKGEFARSIKFFEKAKVALNEEEYFGVFLEDAGNSKAAIAHEIMKLKDVDRNEALELIRNVPAKIYENFTIDGAQTVASSLKELGAQISIRKELEVPPHKRDFLALIEKMEKLAEQGDGSHKVVGT